MTHKGRQFRQIEDLDGNINNLKNDVAPLFV